MTASHVPSIDRLDEMVSCAAPGTRRAAQPSPDFAVPMHAGSGGPTLFLVHPAGGDIVCYTELSELLNKEISIVALADPALIDVGAHPSEDVGTSHSGDSSAIIGELAARYLAAIGLVQPDAPYLLGGWSMGGIVAHEMACQAQAVGDEVALLVMVDSNSPRYIRPIDAPTPAAVQTELILRQLAALEAFCGLDLGTSEAGLRGMLVAASEHDRWEYAQRLLREHHLLGREESLRHRLGVLERHLRGLAAHRPRRLDSATTTTLLIRADLPSPRNSRLGMGIDDVPPDVDDLGWSPHVTGPVVVAGVNAHHYSILQTPSVVRVGELVNDAIMSAVWKVAGHDR